MSHLDEIRESISTLELTKDKLVIRLNQEGNSGVWTDDIKSVYYSIVATWQFLHKDNTNSEPINHQIADSAAGFLRMALSKFKQSISELETFDNERIAQLTSEWRGAFKRCYDNMQEIMKSLQGNSIEKPPARLIEIESEHRFVLRCSICGKEAIVFKEEQPPYGDEIALVYKGIVKSTSLNLNLKPKIRELLEVSNLSRLHELLREKMDYEGMDAYCPECDKIYCYVHFNPEEVWDEGFYDCTYGTCPNGHRRMIDD